MTNEFYEIEYVYYQYNSGAADNGTYRKIISYSDLEKAEKIFMDIKSSIDGTISEDDNHELILSLLPYDGYFKSVQLSKIIQNRIIIKQENKND